MENVKVHENFNTGSKINDIALVRLSKNVQLPKKRREVRTVCLPTEESQQIENLSGDASKLLIAGWGRTENSSVLSDILMKANLDYLPHEDCVNQYKTLNRKYKSIQTNVQEKQMCAISGSKVDA